mmetsp:Transcript_52045/g.110589  ORF Transcript_52045/g.110589 Transcript_52045/m.110589 type:complete len:280 (-) Transcript_52045:343-1182(-)
MLSSARPLLLPRARTRSMRIVSSQSRWSASSGLPHRVTRSCAFSADRGNPSSSIRFPGWSFIRFCMSATIMEEGTRPPLFIISSACLPMGVPAATSALRRSPLDRWTIPHSLTSRSLRRPLPEPGPPTNKIILAGRPFKNKSVFSRNSSLSITPSSLPSTASISFLTTASVGSSPTPRSKSLMSCQSRVISPSLILAYWSNRSTSASFPREDELSELPCSAPYFLSSSTQSACPWYRASSSGVPPQRSTTLTPAPASQSSSTTRTRPFPAARCSAVRLS